MKEKTGKLGISKEITVALITALSTLLAAIISGIFLLYITTGAVRSTAGTPKNTSSITPTVTTVTSFFPSNPSFGTPSTKSNSGATPVGVTPTSGLAQGLLQVSPSIVNFSSCLPTEQRRIALNITNVSTNQLSWSIAASSAYSYSLLDHTGGRIIQGGFSSNVNVSLATKQTQVALISNIQGSGTIFVTSPQAASQKITISCATTTSLVGVSPQSVTFDSCSALNYRTFAFSIINNSTTVLSWKLVNQASYGDIAFATEDGSPPRGQIQGKYTAVILVYNIQSSMALQLSDSTSASYTIPILCG